MKHRFVRRVSALALAGCLLAGSSLPAFAAASAAKEEVIYANLTASGAVTGVYAVNSFFRCRRGTPLRTTAATLPCAT